MIISRELQVLTIPSLEETRVYALDYFRNNRKVSNHYENRNDKSISYVNDRFNSIVFERMRLPFLLYRTISFFTTSSTDSFVGRE